MHSRWTRTILTLALVAPVLHACQEEETTVTYVLCSPRIDVVQPADEGAVVSTGGGTLLVEGTYLWIPDTSASGSSEEPTSTPQVSAHDELADIEVRISGRRAIVTSAYERSLTDVPNAQLADDGSVLDGYSNCTTCASCMEENPNGCGGCSAACAGCIQVVEFDVPLLLPGAGGTSTDDGNLLSWIEVVTRAGRSNALSYSFPPACSDGVDNDSDGAIDDDDSACTLSPWSELPPCEDGVDNDGDGWVDGDDPGCLSGETPPVEEDPCNDGVDNDGDGLIDLADPACADDPRGQSETAFVPPPACANGVDDDGDYLIDADDPRCSSGNDTDESQP